MIQEFIFDFQEESGMRWQNFRMTTLFPTSLIFLLCSVRVIDKSMGIAIPSKLSGEGRFTSAEKFCNEGKGIAEAEERTCNGAFFIGKMTVMAHRNLLFRKDLGHLYCSRGLWAIFLCPIGRCT